MSSQADVNLSNYHAIQENTGAIADLTRTVQAEVTRATAAEASIVSDIQTIVKNLCDTALSDTSTNPVQNKVVKAALDGKMDITSIATVAVTGSYNDLKDKPTIPTPITIDASLSDTSTNAVQNKVIKAELDKKVNATELATVATTGSYNDLKDKPVITNGFTLSTVTVSGTLWRLYVTSYTESGGQLNGITGTLYRTEDGIDTGTGRAFNNSVKITWVEGGTNFAAGVLRTNGSISIKTWTGDTEPETGTTVIGAWWTSGMDVTSSVSNTVDRTPTTGSIHSLVTSGGVYTAVTALDSRLSTAESNYTGLNTSLAAIQTDLVTLGQKLDELNGEVI